LVWLRGSLPFRSQGAYQPSTQQVRVLYEGQKFLEV
jgi:hypothetical protein